MIKTKEIKEYKNTLALTYKDIYIHIYKDFINLVESQQ